MSKRVWFNLSLIFSLFSASFYVFSGVKAEVTTAEQYQNILADFSQQKMVGVQLDFSAAWQLLLKNKQVVKAGDTEQLLTLQQSIKQLTSNDNQLAICQLITLSEMNFQTQLMLERHQLLAKTSADAAEYQSRFIELENGKEWYLHWLKSWLLAEVNITTLEQQAYRELNNALMAIKELKQVTPKPSVSIISGNNKKQIVRLFKQREKQINQRLTQVLGSDFIANPVAIEKSNFPESFPAPGIYLPDSGTFLYHLTNNAFPKHHMDWLFLHEGVPGHHYQSNFVNQNALCEGSVNISESTVFTEGWAAYVETLGTDLGVYQQQSSERYALDWQALRAVRVIIDIGIHYHGWSDKKAQEIWRKYIPEQEDIMMREINRIKRWPVQVITYVYGKSLVLETIEQIKLQNPTVALPEIHRFILSISNLSPSTQKLWLELWHSRVL